MARGVTSASTLNQREERTKTLFSRLERAGSDAERERITAELVELNLPLCDALAGRYVGRGAEYDDLVQVARTALLLAIRRFRPAELRSFASFAVPTITGELKRHFRDHCWVVRPPRQIQELRAQVVRERERLEQESGRAVSHRELGEHLGVDARRVEECFAAAGSYRPLSLEAPAREDGWSNLAATLSNAGDLADEVVEHLDLNRALSSLSRRERLVLEWRFADECTQSEIARRLGVSQMQVSRIIRRLLAHTRMLLESPGALAS